LLGVTLVLVSLVGIGAGMAAFPASGDETPTAVEPPRPVPAARAMMLSDARSYTPNFQVDAPTRRTAHLLADAAERQRKELAVRWLGTEMPPWPEPCTVQVQITDPRDTSGATSFSFDKGKVTLQRMILKGSLETLLATTLPHEVTHTVWASAFGVPVPRWADEGAALLSEDDESQLRHASLASEILNNPARKIPLRRLMEMRRFPDDPTVLYAEGYSLTRFLVERKDHRKFLVFVKQGSRDGWDKAVQTHYGFRNVEALEIAWLDSVRQNKSRNDPPDQPSEVSEDRLLPPAAGPAPVTAWAALEKEGRVLIRWPVTYSEPKTEYVLRGPGQPHTPVTAYTLVTTYARGNFDLREVAAYGTDGKRIDTQALRERLRTPLPVLVSQDGRPVSSFYLQVIKEGTLILVPPAPKAPIGPPEVIPAPGLPPSEH
jgi:hypothetical protein